MEFVVVSNFKEELERTIAFIKALLQKRGFRSVEDFAHMTAEAWQEAKLPPRRASGKTSY